MQTSKLVVDNLAPDKNVIMIIDDSPESLKLLTDILARQNFSVRQALSGPAALTSIRHQPLDLILLDLRMPGMDGLEI